MGKAGSKLSAKERIGYEFFFFTAVYGLYNVFFALPLSHRHPCLHSFVRLIVCPLPSRGLR